MTTKWTNRNLLRQELQRIANDLDSPLKKLLRVKETFEYYNHPELAEQVEVLMGAIARVQQAILEFRNSF